MQGAFRPSTRLNSKLPFLLLARTSEILQIAASYGDKRFNMYMVPMQGISEGAKKITKMSFKHGVLYYNKEPVEAVYQHQGLAQFITFLSSVNNPILVGHNIKVFDLPILYNSMTDQMQNQFNKVVVGFLDTLFLFRELYPNRKKYTQPSLVSDLLNETYEAHNALEDVKSLQNLVEKCSNKTDHESQLFTHDHIVALAQYKSDWSRRNDTLQHLVQSKILTDYMTEKMAKSGLSYGHLSLVVKRNGKEGLDHLLKEKTKEGKCRVTNKVNIIDKLYTYMAQNSNDTDQCSH